MSNSKLIVGQTDLLTVNPELAAQWHPTKNEDLTPSQVYARSAKKVWWLCEKGHEWPAPVVNRTKGSGCPHCMPPYRRRVTPGENDLLSVNPELAAQWHPTKNGDLLPSQVTANSNLQIWWQCEKGHEWQASVFNRTRGTACPHCTNHFSRLIPGQNDLATVNPDLAAQWHPIKNGALTPIRVTAGSSKKVWWLCDKGHEWEAVIDSRSRGSGCPICSGRKLLPGFNDLATVDPDLASQWHPTKNGDLRPQDVFPGKHTLVWWQCEKGHEWQAGIFKRRKGAGCPVCSNAQKGPRKKPVPETAE